MTRSIRGCRGAAAQIGNLLYRRVTLAANQTGDGNTAIGENTLSSSTDTTGSNNTTLGRETLTFNASGLQNTAVGFQALFYNVTGRDNIAVGAGGVANNTNGSFNVALGSLALFNTISSNNIAVGYAAGFSNVLGTNNIFIGHLGTIADSSTVRIGNSQNKTFIAGISGTAVAGSTVVVNGSGQLGVAVSSARFKHDIHSMGDASDVLLALKPVTFRYKPDIDPEGTPQFGLIAEEVDKVDSDLVLRDDKQQIHSVR